MKLAIILFVILKTVICSAQILEEAEFEDGSTISFTYSEDPYNVPKYQFELSPFGPGAFNIGYKAQAYYNFNTKSSIRSKFIGVYYVPNFEIGEKNQIFFTTALETSLFKIEKNRLKPLTLKIEGNSRSSTSWRIQKYRRKLKDFRMVSGLGFMSDWSTTYIGGDRYLGPLTSYTSNLGVVWHRTESHFLKSETLKKVVSGAQIQRLFFNLYYGFNFEYSIIGEDEITSHSSSIKTSEFETILKPLGWSFGGEYSTNFNNSRMSASIGFEMCFAPSYSLKIGSKESNIQTAFAKVFLGLGFGNKPWRNIY
ncbi:MAG: hypothetical protein ACPGU5_06255 [Lishizhenia sp.]